MDNHSSAADSTNRLVLQTTFGALEVQYGVLDENATRALMTGHCVAIASAIARRTGWQTVADFGHEVFEDTEELTALVDARLELPVGVVHAWARTGDGLLLDAAGSRTAEEYESRIGEEFDEDVALYTLPLSTAVGLAEHYCPAPNWAWVESMVEPVLDKSFPTWRETLPPS